ncbi:hypothetical protein AY599_23650 [Leptolyngbya valderiana BDU 20041]|nr:hypothetical protein AY599_23650 [Leptolyngbya valderiana BDU 20041]
MGGAYRSDLIDIAMCEHWRTAKAIKVSDDGDPDKAVWLPLSLVEVEPDGPGGMVTVTLPERLAIDKGLV